MSAKETCIETLRMQILRLEIAPGANLDEASLSAEHGLSRTPLREVLQRLAGEGYVTLTAHRGATVASMDLTRMRVFFQTAPLIYASIARMAAELARPQALAALTSTQRAFVDATQKGDVEEAALLTHRLQALIGEKSENHYLHAALGRLLIDHTRLSQTFYRPTSESDRARIRTAVDQHDEMIAAFEARDGAVVTDVTLRHWDLSRDSLDRYVRPDPLPHDLQVLRDAI
mgnify:CR=1 FL=1